MPKSTAFRILLGVIGLIVIVAVVGTIAFFVISGMRNKPIEVKTYPGAQRVAQQKFEGEDRQVYTTNDGFEDVGRFYSGQDDTQCQTIYQNVQPTNGGQDSVRENPQYIKCSMDRSWMNISQYAEIAIYPTMDESGNVIEGPTTIYVTRVWGK
jgi:hypothetical protein